MDISQEIEKLKAEQTESLAIVSCYTGSAFTDPEMPDYVPYQVKPYESKRFDKEMPNAFITTFYLKYP